MEESAKATILDTSIDDHQLLLWDDMDQYKLSDDGISMAMFCFHIVLAMVEEEEAGEGSKARCNHGRGRDDFDLSFTCKSDGERDLIRMESIHLRLVETKVS